MSWGISSSRDYLIVAFDPLQNLLWVDLYDDLSEVRTEWGPHDTVSPLWPIGRKKDHPVLTEGLFQTGFFVFLSGRQAGSIMADLKPIVSENVLFWLTVGYYSVAIFVPVPQEELVYDSKSHAFEAQADLAAQTARDASIISQWISQNITSVSAEAWLILIGEQRTRGKPEPDDRYTYIACTQQFNGPNPSLALLETQALLNAVSSKPFSSAASGELEELVATASLILQRSIRSPLRLDKALKSALGAAAILIDTANDHPERSQEIGYLLSEIASGLTDLGQQAATGIAPIRYSASTIWPHTLLGLGTAVAALCRLDAFVSEQLAAANFNQQLASLSRTHTIEGKISKLLGRPKPELRIPKSSFSLLPESEREPPLTRAATFERRGAFESTATHIRVPRHCLSGTNSVAESIFPICHEFAKAPAGSIIEQTFNAALDDSHLDEFWPRYRSTHARQPDDAAAMLDYCAELVIRECKAVYLGDDASISTDAINKFYDQCRADPELVRGFFAKRYVDFTQPISDSVAFIYFYRSELPFFIQSYLASWQSTRTGDQAENSLETIVSRILGAVAARKYGESFSSLRLREEVQASIDGLPGKWSDRLAFAKAYIRQLPGNSLRRAELNASIGFIVHQFFTSKPLLGALWHDQFARRGRFEPESYGATPGKLEDQLRIGNPLAFLFSCARDLDPDEAKSVWLLHHLAYYDDLKEA